MTLLQCSGITEVLLNFDLCLIRIDKNTAPINLLMISHLGADLIPSRTRKFFSACRRQLRSICLSSDYLSHYVVYVFCDRTTRLLEFLKTDDYCCF